MKDLLCRLLKATHGSFGKGTALAALPGAAKHAGFSP